MTALAVRRHDPDLPIPPRDDASTVCMRESAAHLCSLRFGHEGPHAAYACPELPFRVWTDDAYRAPFLEDLEQQVARATS